MTAQPDPAAHDHGRVVRIANARELEIWDDLTVHPAGGHALQSMAWARHRAALGWRPHHLVLSDGSAALALERPWPVIGGGSAYIPRGPIPAGDAATMAARADALAAWLGEHGIDVVATDAEVRADSGYGTRLAERGFHPIEELEPSRHRFTLPLGAGADEGSVLAGVARSTRQRIRSAERDGISVVRHDASLSDDRGLGSAAGWLDPGEGFVRPAAATAGESDLALDRFYDLLLATGERRGFGLGLRARALAWWRAAYVSRLLILLEARSPDGRVIAGLVLYRHGGRLSTVHSADEAATRALHPGALHLLRWRAIQLALREGCAEMDLGGVDLAGSRHEPRQGDPMYGLAEHKRAFGAVWLELTGAHERVIRPWRYAVGRVAARALRVRGAR